MRDFSKYLKDGRRVAAFGEHIGNEVEIFLLYCSKKDQFSKQFAKHIYRVYKEDKYLLSNPPKKEIDYYSLHPVIFRIPIKQGDSAEYTFKIYMNENFYRKVYMPGVVNKITEYLVNFKDSKSEYVKVKERYAVKKLSS